MFKISPLCLISVFCQQYSSIVNNTRDIGNRDKPRNDRFDTRRFKFFQVVSSQSVYSLEWTLKFSNFFRSELIIIITNKT